ncbi:MAG: hypothetical protein AAFQ45_00910 [Pseudomonadota bacterium]
MAFQTIALWGVAAGVSALVLYTIWAGEGAVVRYLLAMLLAGVSALLATLFISSPVATWVTNRMTFESPDGAADVHTYTFLGVNIAALVIGWSAGWLLSRNVAAMRNKGG